jgi:hypothetical protein
MQIPRVVKPFTGLLFLQRNQCVGACIVANVYPRAAILKTLFKETSALLPVLDDHHLN